MNKILVFSVFFTLAIQTGFSQNETFDDAEFFFNSEEYEEALFLYKQLAGEYPDNENIQYQIGMCYLNIPGEENKAIPHLEAAIQNTTLKHKRGEFSVEQAPYHAHFYLGNAYRMNNELDKALDIYEKFMSLKDFERKYNLRIVEEEINACQRAKIIKDSPIKFLKENLGPEINASSRNFHPVVNPDETILIFMQKQKFYDAIMYSVWKNDAWSKPVNITPQVGSDGDMLPTGISPDGKKLLLTKNNKDETKDIFISSLEGKFWSKAENISDNINSKYNEEHASFSSDGKSIVFSSDRRKGFGGLDIYFTTHSDNSWSKPVNFGSTINTDQDETSAYLLVDGQQLYFASRSHFNMGGYDIFFSEKKDGKWIDPVNIGFPLNTTGENKFYQPVNNGNAGYISLVFDEENLNKEDIYRVEIDPFENIPEKSDESSNRND